MKSQSNRKSQFSRIQERVNHITAEKSHLGTELVVSRLFKAPRDLVWNAWTRPELLREWWGPAHFTAPTITSDFHVGGKYLYCMRSPDGQDFWSTGFFKEISDRTRIVATDSFADAEGRVVPASTYGLGVDFPRELTVTTTFEDHGAQTRLTLHHAGLPAGEMLHNTRVGWNESLDKLEALLKRLQA